MEDLDAFFRLIAPFAIPLGLALGVAGLISAFVTQARGSRSIEWKATEGELLDCGVVTVKHKSRGTTVSETHHVEIAYRYSVNGRSYTGHNFTVASTMIGVESRREGERLASKFKAARLFDVYYDPQKPEMSALKPGRDSGAELSNAIGGIFLIAGAVMLFVIYRPYGF